MKHLFAILLALLGFTTATAQDIPQYDTVEATPADGTTISALTTIVIDLSREGYDAPLGIMPGSAEVTVVSLTAADAAAQPAETPIDAPKATVNNAGQLLITFATPYRTPGTVEVRIPAGLTNNLAMPVATMTPQEICDNGGCTNPAITLRYKIEPAILSVKAVTGIGYDPEYLKDANGNFLKDEAGQYIRQDKYDSLVDAQLTPAPSGSDIGNRVTVIYFWYDEAFSTIDYQGGASVVNVTTGKAHDIASVGFKSCGDSHRNDVIELRLSTAAYIYSEQHHQGVYEVTLPEGIAMTADGRQSGGMTFRFTFGDPAKAYVPVALDLDPYLGDYLPISEKGEETTGECFTFEKDDAGHYYITKLCGSSLRIPIESLYTEKYVAKFTKDDTSSFMSLTGSDVLVMFQVYEGQHYIFLDQYALYMPDSDTPIIGGEVNFVCTNPAGLQSLAADAARPATPLYDLQGRALPRQPKGQTGAAPTRHGIYIKDGKKLVF